MDRGRRGETKTKILRLLARGPKGWAYLKGKLGISDSALSRHLNDLIKSDLVRKDKNTKSYVLSGKGGAYLMQVDQKLIINKLGSKAYYFNRIQPDLDAWSLISNPFFGSNVEDLPIPLPYDASMVISEEVSHVLEESMDFLRWHERLSDREAELKTVEGFVFDLARRFIWEFIWNKIFGIMNWEINFKEGRTTKEPPRMTIDEVLNFQVGLMIQFDGNQHLSNLKTRTKAKYILAGCLLMHFIENYGWFGEYDQHSILKKLVEGNIIEDPEVIELHRIIHEEHFVRPYSERNKRKKSKTSPQQIRQAKNKLLEIAISYFKKGGLLKDVKETASELAEEIFKERYEVQNK